MTNRKTISFSAWLKLHNVWPSDNGYIPVYTDRKTGVSKIVPEKECNEHWCLTLIKPVRLESPVFEPKKEALKC
jgi:hypothetical protein|nr:MAG TPA: hypothetical protein [Caudoviricetes sp.]